jgi:hypothetical protein
MRTDITARHITARHITAGVFGALAGVGTLTHGIGEMIQGNVPTPGLWFPSWTTGPIAEHLDGDPALGILPTMLASGIATTAASIALIGVSAATVVVRGRGRRWILPLAGVTLLTGGGGAPPVLAALAGLAGMRAWERPVSRLSTNARRRLARAWAPLCAVGVANGVFLVFGSVVLTAGFGFHAPDVFVYSFLGGAVLLLVLGPLAAARDAVDHATSADDDAAGGVVGQPARAGGAPVRG